MKKVLYIVLAFVVIVGGFLIVKKLSTSQNSGGNPMPSGDTRALEVSYLKSAVAADILPYAYVEVPAIENIATGTENGAKYLSLGLFKGQSKINNGLRSEISVDYPYNEGDTVQYSWEFKFVSPFPYDPQNRWWVLADWHVQPDVTKGETWDNFPNYSSPLDITFAHVDGKNVIALNCGIDSRVDQNPKGVVLCGSHEIQVGAWNKMTATVTWSEKEDGKARFTLNGAQVFSYDGRNMINAYQHYFKTGLYHDPNIQLDNTVYIRNVQITKR